MTTIREAVRAVLSLFEESAPDDELELRLVRAVDRLVVAVHDVRFEFDVAEYADAPRFAYGAARALVTSRFPEFGSYSVPASMRPTNTEVMLGDAVDDLADLIIELRAVEWCFAHASEADALWHLENGFRTHWAAHVRWLQVFLLERQLR
ncbi:MAG: DUF5063 domain-containing protein [Archangiaceae bacterium]|nr:DUF5063 domain-containing protein [Archangiaceae bacterium]